VCDCGNQAEHRAHRVFAIFVRGPRFPVVQALDIGATEIEGSLHAILSRLALHERCDKIGVTSKAKASTMQPSDILVN